MKTSLELFRSSVFDGNLTGLSLRLKRWKWVVGDTKKLRQEQELSLQSRPQQILVQ